MRRAAAVPVPAALLAALVGALVGAVLLGVAAPAAADGPPAAETDDAFPDDEPGRVDLDAARAALAAARDALEADPRDPVAGDPDGDVAVVEFSDYQCGFCRMVHPTVRALLDGDPGVRRVRKEFPILGPASVSAARAALAAHAQGRHAEMDAALMALRGRLDDGIVMRVAAEVGLDLDRLRADMASPAVEEAIRAARELAASLGIRGTPTFVVGDRVVPGAVDLETLRQFVRDAREARGDGG